MSTEQWIALSAVVVAALALVATALLAVALRRIRADVRRLADAPEAPRSPEPASPPQTPAATGETSETKVSTEIAVATPVPLDHSNRSADEIVTRDGRVVVVPSTRQVVEATMGKPMIRGAVLSHGLRYALRPESRDRLRGIIRREYRRRRKIRLRAGRRAARTATIPPRDVHSWVGTRERTQLNVDDDGGS